MFLYGNEVKSFLLPVRPCTFTAMMRLLVNTTPSRIDLYESITCSPSSNNELTRSAYSSFCLSLKKPLLLKSIMGSPGLDLVGRRELSIEFQWGTDDARKDTLEGGVVA